MDIEAKKKMDADEAEKAKKAKDEAEKAKKGENPFADQAHKEPDGDEAKKSVAAALTRDELKKGMDALAAFAGSSQDARRVELLEKAKSNVLSAEEKTELRKSMFDDATPGPAEQIAQPLVREPLAKSEKVELTAAIDEMRKGIVGAVENFGKLTDDKSRTQEEFNLMLTKSMLSVGRAVGASLDKIDSLEKSLAKWAELPANAPRFVQPGIPQTPAAQPGQRDSLSKSQALDILTEMHQDSLKAGMGGRDRRGNSLLDKISSVESNGINMLSENDRKEMSAFLSHRS